MDYVGKNPSTVVLPDRSTIAFINDRIPEGIAPPAPIGIANTTGEKLYSVAAENMPIAGERCLIYSVSRPDGGTGGTRCCTYYDANAGESYVLREAINPQIAYDKSSNSLTIWFWSNLKPGFTGGPYSEDAIYRIDEDNFDQSELVTRALCNAVGSMNKCNISGGEVISASGGIDLVPVFAKPTFVQLFRTPDQSASGGYAIIDFGATGGGSIVTFKFKNVGTTNVAYYDTLTTDSSVTGMTDETLALIPVLGSAFDAPAIVYLCMTKAGVAVGETGTAGYLTGPSWVQVDISGTLRRAGMIVGAHSTKNQLAYDVPGYRVLAIKTDLILGEMALITPDHRPIVMRSQVLPDGADATYTTERWLGETESGLGDLGNKAIVLPPPPFGPSGPSGP